MSGFQAPAQGSWWRANAAMRDHLAIGPWAGLAVLAAYSATTLLAGTTTFLVRDS